MSEKKTKRGRNREDDISVVYFAATITPNGRVSIKIGSTLHLASRLGHIQRNERIVRHQRPIIVHLEVGGYIREYERHAQFAAYRIDRDHEWFTADVLDDPSVISLGDPHEYVAAHPEIYTCVIGWAGHQARPPQIAEAAKVSIATVKAVLR